MSEERVRTKLRRRRSRATPAAPPAPSWLSIGVALGRKQKIAACAAVFVAACLLSALCREFEMRDSLVQGSVISAVGLAPAVFVTTLVAGTFLIAQLIAYRRRRLWIMTLLLISFLALQAFTWQRAYTLTRESAEPQIVGDPDHPNPMPPISPGSVDTYILVLYTLGILCTISAFLTMRRMVPWHTPSSELGKHRHRHHPRPDALPSSEAETALAVAELNALGGSPLKAQPEPTPLAEIEIASPVPEPAPEPPPPPQADADEAAPDKSGSRARRLFE